MSCEMLIAQHNIRKEIEAQRKKLEKYRSEIRLDKEQDTLILIELLEERLNNVGVFL